MTAWVAPELSGPAVLTAPGDQADVHQGVGICQGEWGQREFRRL